MLLGTGFVTRVPGVICSFMGLGGLKALMNSSASGFERVWGAGVLESFGCCAGTLNPKPESPSTALQ